MRIGLTAIFVTLLLPLSVWAAPSTSVSFGVPVPISDAQAFVPILFTSTENTSVNALEIEVLVDQDVVQIDDMILSPVFCDQEFLTASVIESEYGIAYKRCGTPYPTATSSAIIGHLLITKLSNTPTTLTFGSHTNAHIHDGLGTQVIDTRETRLLE